MKLVSFCVVLGTVTLMAQSYFVKGPENPKPHEATAMQELTDYLARRIGDQKLVIGGSDTITFQVGDTELAREYGLLSSELPEEKWRIKSIGDQVILNGGGTRGALYATYHFLEDYCGVHWWNDIEDYVPKTSDLELDKLDAGGQPAFFMRDMYIQQVDRRNSRTRARVRINGCDGVDRLPEFGGALCYGGPSQCHTFDFYIPTKEYMSTHPEYFSLVNGKRVGGQTEGQLCVSNSELRREFLRRLLDNIGRQRENAKAKGLSEPRLFDVSMNDNDKRCQCENCKAEEEKYNPSGLYVNFANYLAAEVAKLYPDVYLSMIAYNYTEPAPKGGVKASDNVIIRLCDIRTNQAASILEPCNKLIVDLLKDWQDHAPNLQIWDYAITFSPGITGLPFASEWHYGDLFRTYLANNVKGIFWEHENPHMADMWELKFFLEAKLMEDPSLDNVKLIETFMDCYYGAAAPFILEYRRSLDKVRKEKDGSVLCGAGAAAFKFIGTEELLKYEDLFDKAEKAVEGDDVLFRRVRHARAGIDRLICIRSGNSGVYHGARKVEASPFDAATALERLVKYWPDWARQFANGNVLASDIDKILDKYKGNTAKALPPPAEFKDRNFYDFYAPEFGIYGKEHIRLVKDGRSPVGESVQIDADSDELYKLPFTAGFYDEGHRQTLVFVKHEKVPDQDDFSWFSGGKVKIAEHGFVFLTNTWCVSLSTNTLQQLAGKEYEIFVSARFEGPYYRPGQTGENHIYLDRVLLVEPME